MALIDAKESCFSVTGGVLGLSHGGVHRPEVERMEPKKGIKMRVSGRILFFYCLFQGLIFRLHLRTSGVYITHCFIKNMWNHDNKKLGSRL